MTSSDEGSFLSSYNIEDYFRPSVTADVAAFSIGASGLSVLMIERGTHPFKGCWALPGGFLQRDETLEQCALREITEEAAVSPVSLMPIGIFSEVDRDPRGRIISQAYTAIISEDVKVAGGDDATDARWFDVKFLDGHLTLVCGDIRLAAVLKQTAHAFGNTRFEIVDGGGIAFDHAGIIASAVCKLSELADNTDIVFDFLPEKFTLTQMQRVQETLLGKKLIAANFRRKITSIVIETDDYTEGDSHRPARLFKRRK